MKLNEQMKRQLVVFGCMVVGAVLIAVIGSQFRGEAQGSNHTEAWAEQAEEMAVAEIPTETIKTVTTEEKTRPTKPGIVMRTEPATKPSRVGTTEPTETLLVQTDRTEQAMQSVPGRPIALPEEVLKNPTQEPDGETVEGTLEAIPRGEVVQFSEVPTQAGEPQHEDIQNRETYVPGFGWVDKTGEGQGTVAEGIHENRNRIGVVD